MPSLASHDLKIENNSMLVDENSIDPDDVRDEWKFELVVLNGILMKLDKDWDFSNMIRQLSSDPRPALAIVSKLRRQIERMTKLRDAFLRTKQEKPLANFLHTAQEYCRPLQQEQLAFRLPVQRYSASVDRTIYSEVVLVAKWVYEWIQSHPGGPGKCTVRSLRAAEQPPPPAAGEVACRDAVGVQNCGRRWAGGKCGMYISSGGQREALEGWTAMNGRNATQRATIIQFQHGSFKFTLQAPNGCCAKVIAGVLGWFHFLPPTPRAGSPRTRKYTKAASSSARNSSR